MPLEKENGPTKLLRRLENPGHKEALVGYLTSKRFAEHLRWLVRQTQQTGREHQISADPAETLRARGNAHSVGAPWMAKV